MKRLGALGRDLGEIVEADLPRVRRARDASDFAHAELAARDLSARLRQPDPSFGAKGSGGRAGGESGGGRGTPGDDEQPPDDVEQAFDEAASDLGAAVVGPRRRDEQDGAGPRGCHERRGAEPDARGSQAPRAGDPRRRPIAARRGDGQRLLDQQGRGRARARRADGAIARAGAHRRGVAERPQRAWGRSTTRSGCSRAEARSRIRAGRGSSASTTRAASSRASLDGWPRSSSSSARGRRSARETSSSTAATRRVSSPTARESSARRDATRARSRSRRSSRSRTPSEAARQASDALKQGDADKGLDRQREAQRDLEAAREQLQGEDDGAGSPPSGASEGKRSSAGHVDVPNDYKGPEEFRRRVVRGLGQPASGSLRDAVQRYAEGLLR